MTGETVECYNCGRANPAWAQVCRSCGVPMRPGSGMAASSGPIPRDRESLISIAVGLAAIVGAVILGVVLSGIIPEATVVEATATPTPTVKPTPSGSKPPADASAEPSAEPSQQLIGTITLGTGLNDAEEATGETDTFGPGASFCHSRTLSEPFGVESIQEEILRLEDDGSLTVVQRRRGSNLPVDANSQTAGFCAPGGTDSLLADWGEGTFVMRDYRRVGQLELVAEARFTLAP
jgi:hypothetical protein